MADYRKHRKVCGITATRGDGKIWTWTVRHRVYRWCPLGHVEEFMDDGGMRRVAYARSLDGGIAWTVGYAMGQSSVLGDLPEHPGRNGRA